jgi:DNA-binding CsgD family transcriptional regulator
MAESSTSEWVLPTALEELPLDDRAWSDIYRFAAAAGLSHVAAGGLLQTRGGTPVCVVLVERRAESLPSAGSIRRRFRLTEREAEVALLLAGRLSSHEVAAQLGVTVHTARRHTEQVLGKLGIGNRTDVRSTLLRLAEEDAARAAA